MKRAEEMANELIGPLLNCPFVELNGREAFLASAIRAAQIEALEWTLNASAEPDSDHWTRTMDKIAELKGKK